MQLGVVMLSKIGRKTTARCFHTCMESPPLDPREVEINSRSKQTICKTCEGTSLTDSLSERWESGGTELWWQV